MELPARRCGNTPTLDMFKARLDRVRSKYNYLVEILSNAVNVDKHYKLRNEDDIEQFQFRTEKFRKSLFPDCVRKWNSLEKDLRKECSFNAFRTKVITNTVANCSKLYYVGQRKFNIILAQLRMNCSNLNAHLYSLHVIDSPACGCSHRVEDTVTKPHVMHKIMKAVISHVKKK